uniref:Putative molecular chaperone dnaj superfamily n=1 Tax=Nyssomyia neivai TaxID=330878 RepID=A0A1L8DU47_9DIPT
MSSKKNLYEVLGVKETATQAEIKKAFKTQTKQNRQNNSPEAKERFAEVKKAFEILSNPTKREWYDEFGDGEEEDAEAVEEEGSDSDGETNFQDMFGNMSIFSRLSNMSKQGRKPKCEPLLARVEVTLEDLYNGNVTKTTTVGREILCAECAGEGAKDGGKVHKCDTCKGSGMEFEHHQMGFFINRVSTACATCHGQGNVINDEDKCSKCNGSRTFKEDKSIEVRIEPGMFHMQKIEFTGQGNHMPGHLAGDIVAVLDYVDHKTFERAQDNLLMRKTITLVEALCGFRTLIHHLDGRKLHIHNSPGDIIKSGSHFVVKNEGMPRFGKPAQKGDLLIKFSIQYPENSALTSENLAALKGILPPGPEFVMPEGENVEEVNMYDLEDMNFAGSHPFQSAGVDDDDDDEFGGGASGGIQCQTQ